MLARKGANCLLKRGSKLCREKKKQGANFARKREKQGANCVREREKHGANCLLERGRNSGSKLRLLQRGRKPCLLDRATEASEICHKTNGALELCL